MGEVSGKKTEQKALTKVNDLIDRIDYAESKITGNDKNISWDGTIDLYHGVIDKKENFDYSIDVQLKGRTVYKKKLGDKAQFDLDKKDLKNYLKKDGTLFLVVLFKDIDTYKIYYSALLPYNLKKLLDENKANSNSKIKIHLKEVKDAKHLEEICRNYAINKEEQKKISDKVFDASKLSFDNGKMVKFFGWKSGEFNPISLLGTEQYVYAYDNNDNIININCVIFSEISRSIDVEIKNKSGITFYSNINIEVSLKNNKITFGNAFSLDYSSKKFNIKIKGTLSERIKQLEFIKSIYNDKGFYINNGFTALTLDEEFNIKFSNLFNVYKKINDFLINHKISKDLNLDTWTDGDVNKLLIWIGGIEEKIPLTVSGFKTSTLGSIKINDLRISIFADKQENGDYIVYNYKLKK